MAFIWRHYHKKIWRYQSVKPDWKLHAYNWIQISQGQWVKMKLTSLMHKPIDINITSNSNHTNGLAQDCGNSSALAKELPQSCAKWSHRVHVDALLYYVIAVQQTGPTPAFHRSHIYTMKLTDHHFQFRKIIYHNPPNHVDTSLETQF